MAKELAFCAILVGLAIVAESSRQSSSFATAIGTDTVDAFPTDVEIKRTKRYGRAPEVLNSVAGLVTGILGTTFQGIAQVNRNKWGPGRTVVVGPGNNNENRVMINGNGWDYQQGRSNGWNQPIRNGPWNQQNQPSSGGWNQPSNGGWNQPSNGAWNQPVAVGTNQAMVVGTNQVMVVGTNQVTQVVDSSTDLAENKI